MNHEQDPEDKEFCEMQYDKAAWFMDVYEVPLSAAVQMSKWKNPTGEHWKEVLRYLGLGDTTKPTEQPKP